MSQFTEITIPCPADQLGEFISGLLGRPQTIEKDFLCTFALNQSDFRNTYDLLSQRLMQNNTQVVSFVATIMFDDASSVEMRSIEEFDSYRVVRPLKSIGVRFFWTVLVQFNNDHPPERQTIEVYFSSEPLPNEQNFARHFSYERGNIHLKIAHTNRTWGTDIEHLLNGHIEDCCEDPNPYGAFLNEHSSELGLATGCLFVLLATLGIVYAADAAASSNIFAVEATNLPSQTIADIGARIDNINSYLAQGLWNRFSFIQLVFFAISFILAFFIGGFTATLANVHKNSFILLADKAEKAYQKYVKAERIQWIKLIITTSCSIVAALFSRIAFYYISLWWLG